VPSSRPMRPATKSPAISVAKESTREVPHCTASAIDIFSEHYEIHIKVAVAENPNISQETAKKLIKYRSVKVKKALEKNSSVKFD